MSGTELLRPPLQLILTDLRRVSNPPEYRGNCPAASCAVCLYMADQIGAHCRVRVEVTNPPVLAYSSTAVPRSMPLRTIATMAGQCEMQHFFRTQLHCWVLKKIAPRSGHTHEDVLIITECSGRHRRRDARSQPSKDRRCPGLRLQG